MLSEARSKGTRPLRTNARMGAGNDRRTSDPNQEFRISEMPTPSSARPEVSTAFNLKIGSGARESARFLAESHFGGWVAALFRHQRRRLAGGELKGRTSTGTPVRRDAELLHLGVEGTTTDPQGPRRSGAIPTALLKRLGDAPGLGKGQPTAQSEGPISIPFVQGSRTWSPTTGPRRPVSPSGRPRPASRASCSTARPSRAATRSRPSPRVASASSWCCCCRR